MTRGCLAGTAVCFISNIGEVYPCGYLPVSAGSVRECSFAEIWEASPVTGDSMEAEPFCTYEPAQDTDVDLV
jgi:MoaA/NifB/PqqE/SkfB family radical SAM enzyme